MARRTPDSYCGLAGRRLANFLHIGNAQLGKYSRHIEKIVNGSGGSLVYLREHGLTRIEATVEAEETWMLHRCNWRSIGVPRGRLGEWGVGGGNVAARSRDCSILAPIFSIAGVAPEVASRGYVGFECT